MYTDVIIGFDGSDRARDAIALGRRMVEVTGAHPTVVCAHPYMALTSNVEADAAVELSWRAGAARVLEDARRALDGVPGADFRTIADSSPARALHRAAQDAEAALIVVGSTHRGGIGRVLPGTTADGVIHDAPCAVAVAPVGYADTRPAPRGVVGAAVDGGAETERVARVAAGVARRADATLRLLSVVENPSTDGPLYPGVLGYRSLREARRERAEDALRRATVAVGSVTVQRRPCDGSAVDALVAQSEDLDLLVLGSRGFGPLRRVVLGSVSSKVLRSAACPVLVVPRRAPDHLDVAVAPLAAAAAR